MTGNNMKYIHKFTTLTLCAVLLLSGCNTDKAVTTSADTAAVTEEVARTEATTTAASTTTTSATTTAAPEPEKPYGIIPKEAEGVFEITAEPLLDVKAIIDLDENNSFFTLNNGCLFSRDMTKLCYVPYFTSTLNNYIIRIGNSADYSYNVPESVIYIAPYAICREGNWLSGIFVPSGVSDDA